MLILMRMQSCEFQKWDNSYLMFKILCKLYTNDINFS